jgi:predicted aminopeptidase
LLFYLRFVRLLFSYILLIECWLAAFHYPLSVYLIKQAKGQAHVLLGTQSFSSYISENTLSEQESKNLQLISLIKQYSIDSLGYEPTNNFTHIYNQNNKPVLWVITASDKYKLHEFKWQFPLLGSVSYKGFFEKELALKEKNKLAAMGYDVGIRSVSAWSTLGWLNDPLLSSHLKKKTGSFCDLLFHELFHATFFEASNINDNENLANFIAKKATLQFLKTDSAAIKEYRSDQIQRDKLNAFLFAQTKSYRRYLDSIYPLPNRQDLKQKALVKMVNNLKSSGITNKKMLAITCDEILTEQNAYFIDYMQYNSKQDSLEKAFNKFYKGSIKNLVQSLNQ